MKGGESGAVVSTTAPRFYKKERHKMGIEYLVLGLFIIAFALVHGPRR